MDPDYSYCSTGAQWGRPQLVLKASTLLAGHSANTRRFIVALRTYLPVLARRGLQRPIAHACTPRVSKNLLATLHGPYLTQARSKSTTPYEFASSKPRVTFNRKQVGKSKHREGISQITQFKSWRQRNKDYDPRNLTKRH